MAQRLAYLTALTGLIVVLAVSPASVRASPSSSLEAPTTQVPPWASRGFIVYKCGDSLCLIRPNGTGKRKLVRTSPWPQWDPAVSPDGRLVAFRGYYGLADGAYALYVVGADGCAVRRLTRSIAGNPSWSPDGKWIVLRYERGRGTLEGASERLGAHPPHRRWARPSGLDTGLVAGRTQDCVRPQPLGPRPNLDDESGRERSSRGAQGHP